MRRTPWRRRRSWLRAPRRSTWPNTARSTCAGNAIIPIRRRWRIERPKKIPEGFPCAPLLRGGDRRDPQAPARERAREGSRPDGEMVRVWRLRGQVHRVRALHGGVQGGEQRAEGTVLLPHLGRTVHHPEERRDERKDD